MDGSLKKYNKKRDFKKTKEPKGKKEANKKRKLRFVVHLHLATRDHYDFRLEWQGTMVSWAVPKGPSFNPQDKRLAVHVEDHPLSYRNFEGVIPKGQYGGGTVMIWDEGYWEAEDEVFGNTLKFTLYGERLKGKWSLVKMKDDNWLLIKERDKYAKEAPGIDRYKKSLRTQRTMLQIEKDENHG